MDSGDRYIAAVVVAILFHGGALGLLHTAEQSDVVIVYDETEVDVLPPEPEEIEPEPPKPPEPEPPEPEPVPEKVAVKVVETTQPKQTERKQAPPIQADEPDDDTAGGDPDLPAPGGTFKMADIVPGGTAMGGVGNSKSSGKGGTGSGTAQGGDGGKGKGNKKPVSIASIKKKAIPLNNRDVIGDRRFNDVAGNVVVKLIVDTTGKVTKTTLIKRLKPEVDKQALAWAKKLRFKPAIDQDDKPVVSVVTWTFTFRPPT